MLLLNQLSPAAVRHNLAIESIVDFLVDYVCQGTDWADYRTEYNINAAN